MGTIKEALRDEVLSAGISCTDTGYVDSYKDNIFQHEMTKDFQEMFDNGSGGELRSKAEAVHSSSMLCYNFFHWISDDNPITIESKSYTKVFFEVKMRVLVGKSAPANMDVLLIGEKGGDGKVPLLFIESKFLEYLNAEQYSLSKSYEEPDKRYRHNKPIDWDTFLSDVKGLVSTDVCAYKGGIKQGVSHLFALSNLSNDDAFRFFKEKNKLQNALKGVKSIEDANIFFMNLIYEPSSVEFEADHKKFSSYKKLYIEFINKAKKHKCIEPLFKTYSDLWTSREIEEQIKKVNNGHLYQYLYDRYMRFAEMK